MYAKIDTQRLDVLRGKQNETRAKLYQSIIDGVKSGEVWAFKVRKRIVLPTSFIGSPRDMRKRYICKLCN